MIHTTLTAPGPGYAVVMASWYFHSDAALTTGSCFLAAESGIADGPNASGGPSINQTGYTAGASLTRMIQIPKGETTFHLNCNGSAAMLVARPQIVALFVPNRY